MINWRLNVAQPAAAVILPADINLRALPGGIDPAIQQPTDEIVGRKDSIVGIKKYCSRGIETKLSSVLKLRRMNEKCKKIFFSTNGCNVQELAGTYVPPMRIYAHTQESVKYCVLRIYIFVILRMRLHSKNCRL